LNTHRHPIKKTCNHASSEWNIKLLMGWWYIHWLEEAERLVKTELVTNDCNQLMGYQRQTKKSIQFQLTDSFKPNTHTEKQGLRTQITGDTE
jgi:hypothetical protein